MISQYSKAEIYENILTVNFKQWDIKTKIQTEILVLSNIYDSSVKSRSATELTMNLRSNRDTKTLLNIAADL